MTPIVRASSRLIFFLLLITGFLLVGFGIHFVTFKPHQRRKRFAKNATFFSRLICKAFGVEVIVTNPPHKKKVGLVVGNHIGFIDIIAVNSIFPSLFVTSNEMKETPGLGLLTELGGCLYVERRTRTNIKKELNEVVEYLSNGFRVVLYPEATSHNGEHVLPFKRTLMTAAAHAGVPILPYCFNFRAINDEAFTMKYRDHVCWYGDIPFHVSLWRSLSLKGIVCEIEFLGEIHAKPEDDRAQLAHSVRELIVQRFVPVQPHYSEAKTTLKDAMKS